MKIGYGTHSGIHNVLFEGNRVDFAGIAIKISSHLGCVITPRASIGVGLSSVPSGLTSLPCFVALFCTQRGWYTPEPILLQHCGPTDRYCDKRRSRDVRAPLIVVAQ